MAPAAGRNPGAPSLGVIIPPSSLRQTWTSGSSKTPMASMMPASALQHAGADAVLPLELMCRRLKELFA